MTAATLPPTPSSTLGWLHAIARQRRRLARADVADGLATLLDAGLPLHEALRTLGSSKGPADRMLDDLRARTLACQPPDRALGRHPGWFDEVDIALVRAAQERGGLADALRTIAARQHRLQAVGSRLATALAYPALVACLALIVVVFLGTGVLPELQAMLHRAQAPVPALTEFVIAAAKVLNRPLTVVAAGLIFVGALGLALAHGPRRSAAAGASSSKPGPRLRAAALRAPVFVQQAALSRLCRAWADLAHAGIPPHAALALLAPMFDQPGTRSLARALGSSRALLEAGTALPEAMRMEGWPSPELDRLLRVATAGGSLPQMLEALGDRLARSAQRSVDRLVGVVEPLSILALSLIVGVVALAAVLPVLALQQHV